MKYSGCRFLALVSVLWAAGVPLGASEVFRFSKLIDFQRPQGVCVDSGGSFAVASSGSQIWKFDPEGRPIFAIGGRTAGYRDGPGVEALLTNPSRVASDRIGNIYFTDRLNGTVRKIDTGGVVTTFAGARGETGSRDGQGAAARFDLPSEITIDFEENLWVAERSAIRRITAAGEVTTYFRWTDETWRAAGLLAPSGDIQGLAVDRDRNVYAILGAAIVRITSDAKVIQVAGDQLRSGWIDGRGEQARFASPRSLVCDRDGNLYTVDNSDVIRRLERNGMVRTVSGNALATIRTAGGQPAFGFIAGLAMTENGQLIASGQGSSDAIVRGVAAPAQPSWLANISARQSSTIAIPMLLGFHVDGNDPVPFVIRGLGPTLRRYGIADAADAVRLTLFDRLGRNLAQNNDWRTAFTTNDAFHRAGAFPLEPTNRDSAMLVEMRGVFTAQAETTSGTALIELYPADIRSRNRVTNASFLTYVDGSRRSAAMLSFIIDGDQYRNILIRGIGPGLASFGVPNPLMRTSVSLHTATRQLGGSSTWTSFNVDMAALFTRVGAFPLTPGSADAALYVTLPPGEYTAVLHSQSTASGEGLLELYDVPF